MCITNTIKNITLIPLSDQKTVGLTIFRSDGEMFKASISLLTLNEANKVRDLIGLIESLRSCECKLGVACEKHRR